MQEDSQFIDHIIKDVAPFNWLAPYVLKTSDPPPSKGKDNNDDNQDA